jgi:hypothetical protein
LSSYIFVLYPARLNLVMGRFISGREAGNPISRHLQNRP